MRGRTCERMKFCEIPGQLRIKNQLIQTVLNNRVSHAQLFNGPEGSGKLALAIAFAQFINCENRQLSPGDSLKADSCGQCPSCVKYQKLAHPDLHLYFPVAARDKKKALASEAINEFRQYLLQTDGFPDLQAWYRFMEIENKQALITAEDCNDMIRVLGYKSFEAEYKVVLIWHAEKIFHAAAPKILKVLEEPPEKTLFILIAANTDLMLNTILSRSQIVKIPRFSDREIVDTLRLKHDLTEAEARRVALLCEGNMKMADDMVARQEGDAQNYARLQQWLRLCFRKDVAGLLQNADELSKIGRENQKALLAYGLRVIRRCLLFNFRLDTLVKLDGEEFTFVRNLSPFINPANGEQLADAFNKALYHIERNANPKILFADLSMKVTALMTIKA